MNNYHKFYLKEVHSFIQTLIKERIVSYEKKTFNRCIIGMCGLCI
jgi:hypothetical protein